MTNIGEIKHELQTKTDLDWFDSICELLKKDKNPTVNILTQIIGIETPNPKNEIRGFMGLDTFDKRFNRAWINPVKNNASDQTVDYLGFLGNYFSLTIGDIAKRFPNYRIKRNTYDGGTQIFFYPVPGEYEFSAIAFWTKKEVEEIENPLNIVANGVSFKFGDTLTEGRDGFGMQRIKNVP